MSAALPLASLLLAAWLGAARAEPQLVVLSQGGATLTATDPAGEGEPRMIALDPAPGGLAVAPDGQSVAVSHADLGRIALVDLESGAVTARIEVGGQPFGLAFAGPDRLLAADWDRDRVLEIDTVAGTVLRSVAVGAAPSAVVVDPAAGLAYSIDRESDQVSIIELAGFTVTGTVAVGRAPFAAALSTDRARLFVANVQSGDLSVVDLAGGREEARVAIGGMPYGVAVLASNSTVVVVDQEGGRIVEVDPGTLETGAAFKVGDYPEGIAALPDGRTVAVANWFSDSVSLVDISTGAVRAVEVAAGPRALAVVAARQAEAAAEATP
ncbi:YncE family protein [Methylobrevis albus]|uniref:YncE family protein n=1 Tax=Methylobrevis albus TaxID=2793297 RepID=A0A931I262_9HYPH|nr:YncE family protein [Methylobrevis albus]MBH0237886.1 YncE family protein [Methylobrevis albus]